MGQLKNMLANKEPDHINKEKLSRQENLPRRTEKKTSRSSYPLPPVPPASVIPHAQGIQPTNSLVGYSPILST
jgi:hypothetical protein